MFVVWGFLGGFFLPKTCEGLLFFAFRWKCSNSISAFLTCFPKETKILQLLFLTLEHFENIGWFQTNFDSPLDISDIIEFLQVS